MRYIEVVFNIPLSSSFTYSVEDSQVCTEGMRVTAFLGKRKLTGYVISVKQEKPDVNFDIKSVEKVIDSEPVFGRDEVDLASWIARVYYCSLGEALGSMLPGGKRESSLPSFDPGDPVSGEEISLSDEQRNAVDTKLILITVCFISSALPGRERQRFSFRLQSGFLPREKV